MLQCNTLTTVQYALIFCAFYCPLKWRYCGIIKHFIYLCLIILLISAATGSCKTAGKHNIRMTGDKGKLAITGDSGSPENMSCTWLITVPQGNLVKLKLSYYALKNSTLQIRDGQNSSSDVLETFRGDKKDGQTIFSSGRHLWVRFQSLQDKGAFFDAEFERVKQSKLIALNTAKLR